VLISEDKAFEKSCPFSMSDPSGPTKCRASDCMAWISCSRDHGRCGLIPSPSMVPASDADELARVTAERDRLEGIVADFATQAGRYFYETD
jgi:hypothetical protein